MHSVDTLMPRNGLECRLLRKNKIVSEADQLGKFSTPQGTAILLPIMRQIGEDP